MPWSDSDPAELTVGLAGVWIHDPETGGQASARHYPYGASQRDDGLDTMGQPNYYAGRESPVVDYGEHSAFVVGVSLDVPHGATWRTDLEDLASFASAKRILFFRDNRGRALYGVMGDLKRTDQDWGTRVSFSVTQVHRDVELVD
jgi:hypothetical protein